MLKKKIAIIFMSLFFIVLIVTACKNNESLSNPGAEKIENSTPPISNSIDNKQREKSNNKPSTESPTPMPKTAPKKESTRKNPYNKQIQDNKVISSFSTILLDSSNNRVSNITLASKKINGYILRPGEVFSFNGVVGKREIEDGYKKSNILINGQRNVGIGGGICQLSSTLYNAAQRSGMEIIERHSHSGDVHYVPRGQDAAVSYGYKDLKFKNSKNYPIKFNVSIVNGKIYVSILKAK